MEEIVFLDRDTIPVPLRTPGFQHRWIDHPKTTPDEVAKRLRTATIAITNKVKITRETLANAPALRFIAVSATGYDCVDVIACSERQIAVSNIPAYAGASTAEHAMLLMLALRRNLPGYQAAVVAGEWQRSAQFTLQHLPVLGLEGAVLGLIGYGDIAQRFEKQARCFGMEVLVAERRGAREARAGRVLFETVLSQADVISLHCPSTAETKGLINAQTLALMKPSAILINTARGSLIDEAALAEALHRGRLGGAGIDVLSEEPPRNGNPLLSLHQSNVLITPHMGWNSRLSLTRVTEGLIDNLEAFVAGHPKNLVS